MKNSEAAKLFKQYKIWLLAPFLEYDDPNIRHYYDFTHSIKEFTSVFEELNTDWKWQPVSMDNFRAIIRSIAENRNGKIRVDLYRVRCKLLQYHHLQDTHEEGF